MKNLQDKRKEDGLAPFNDEDIRIFRDTFDVMGSERVYKKTSDGEPEQIKMCVESVGNLSPQQLFYDAISIIKMRTYAILNQFEWNEKTKETIQSLVHQLDPKQFRAGFEVASQVLKNLTPSRWD